MYPYRPAGFVFELWESLHEWQRLRVHQNPT